MSYKHANGAITLSGLIYTCIIFGMIAIVAMKLFPLYSERMKVNQAMEKIGNSDGAAKLSKREIVKLIGRQFEVSEVRRWTPTEFSKILHIKKSKGGSGKEMNLAYEIRGPFFHELDVVLNYDNTVKLEAGASN